MADEFIKVQVTGLDKVINGLSKMNGDLKRTWHAASREAASEIINTEGLKRYPPETEANKPPVPYYIRGRGMETARGNNLKSERYGTQFYTQIPAGTMNTIIGNRASYAPFLTGSKGDIHEQAKAMGKKGWRKLWDVAKEKTGEITRIYQGWIDRLIRKYNL
jgi:hypothetical protein